MAKLGLLFIVIFCIVQLTLAARIRRDALDDAVDSVKDGISKTFTKEKVDDWINAAMAFGETVKSKGSEIFQTIQEKASEAMKKD